MKNVEIVRASAGSGKTYLLAAEYIASALKSPTAFRSILAVTFTNKATAEMKERIVSQLHKLSQNNAEGFMDTVIELTGYSTEEVMQRSTTVLSEILRDYSSFSVSTIDKFFQRIVRNFFRELGLQLDYEVVIDTNSTITEAIDRIIERSYTESDIAKRLNRIIEQSVESGRSINLHRTLFSLLKSSVEQGFDSFNEEDIKAAEAAFTELETKYNSTIKEFTQKCNEACDLIVNNGMELNDFKYKGSSFASYFFKIKGSGAIAEYGKRFGEVKLEDDPKKYLNDTNNEELKRILPDLLRLTIEIRELYDNSLELRSSFESIAANFSKYTLLQQLCHEFFAILSLRSELSLGSTTTLIRSVTSSSEVPFIFERLGSRYSTIFIDEFQDTSLGQWDGFFPLIEEAASKCEQRCVMLIGDIKQAIYRFRGGDWRLIGGVAEHQLGSMVEEHSRALTTSWRSEPKIVEFNNRVIKSVIESGCNVIDKYLNEKLIKDEEHSELSEYLSNILPSAYSDMQQDIAPHRIGGNGGYVEWCFEEGDELLEWIVSRVSELKTRYSASKIAILVENRRYGAMVIESLIENNIEFISDEVLRLGNSATVNFVISILTLSLRNGTDPITVAQINKYLNRELNEALNDSQLEFIASLRFRSILEAMELIISYFELSEREVYFTQALYNTIYGYTKRNGHDIAGFIESWNDSLCNNSVPLSDNDSAVRVMTIHKSKGLEFEAVIVPFTSWALLPDRRTTIWGESDNKIYDRLHKIPLTYTKALANSVYWSDYFSEGVSSIVDNINMLYVALTRPKQELYLGISNEGSRKGVTASNLLAAALPSECNDLYFGTPHEDREVQVKDKSKENKDSQTPLIFNRFVGYNQPALKILESTSDEQD